MVYGELIAGLMELNLAFPFPWLLEPTSAASGASEAVSAASGATETAAQTLLKSFRSVSTIHMGNNQQWY